jgi:hypothetical protein
MSQQTPKDTIYFTDPDSPVLPNKFDCRVRRRHLTRGVLTQDELKKFHKTLPDESNVAEFRDYDALLEVDDNDSDEAEAGPVGSGLGSGGGLAGDGNGLGAARTTH